MKDEKFSEKSRLAALLLCWLLGIFGAHRYYAGKIGTGILMLMTGGGLGIWWLVDFVMVITGAFKDKSGARLYCWFERGSIRETP